MSDRPSRVVPPDGTLPAVVRGAALVGLAVVVGLILLAQVDGESGTGAATKRPAATTTTTSVPTTTTTLPSGPARIPGELPLIVLNAGGPAGSAGALSERLRDDGYTDQLPANDWEGEAVSGVVVLCREGLAREAAALVVAIGDADIAEFPSPAPSVADGADCVVAVGTGTSTATTVP